jgi:hypothetical protein
MKKIMITVLSIAAIGFAGCKKSYECECNITRSNGSGYTSSFDGNYTFKDSRPRAEKRCNDQESAGNDIFGSYTRDCEIKNSSY